MYITACFASIPSVFIHHNVDVAEEAPKSVMISSLLYYFCFIWVDLAPKSFFSVFLACIANT